MQQESIVKSFTDSAKLFVYIYIYIYMTYKISDILLQDFFILNV